MPIKSGFCTGVTGTMSQITGPFAPPTKALQGHASIQKPDPLSVTLQERGSKELFESQNIFSQCSSQALFG